MASPEISQPGSSDEPLFDFEESYRAINLSEFRIVAQLLCDEIQAHVEAGEYDDELLAQAIRKGFEILGNELDISPESTVNATMRTADVENITKAEADSLPEELKITGRVRAFGILGINIDPQTGEYTQHVPIIVLDGMAETYKGPFVVDPMVRTEAITSLEVLE